MPAGVEKRQHSETRQIERKCERWLAWAIEMDCLLTVSIPATGEAADRPEVLH
jgi:hypothetical protein